MANLESVVVTLPLPSWTVSRTKIAAGEGRALMSQSYEKVPSAAGAGESPLAIGVTAPLGSSSLPQARSKVSGAVPVAIHCTWYAVSHVPNPSGCSTIAAGGAAPPWDTMTG